MGASLRRRRVDRFRKRPLPTRTAELGYELDFALIDGGARLNVEIDGEHHAAGADGARAAALAAEGWRVLRLPAWRCYSEPDAAARDVAREWDRMRGAGGGEEAPAA